MKKFTLTEARESYRRNGSYLNRLRVVLSRHEGLLAESEWREKIGDNKFEEAVEYGLLKEEEVERGGPMLIKEKPPQPERMHPLKTNKVLSYNAGDGGETLVVDVENNGVTGRIRLNRKGKDSDWSTDNLDLIDAEMCQDLTNIHGKLWDEVEKKDPFGEDPGKLSYSVRSQCAATGLPQ